MVPPLSIPQAHTSSSVLNSHPQTEAGVTSGSNSTMDKEKLLTFLNEYRALECAVCSTVFGFQHKATGVSICTGGCHEKDCAAAMNNGTLGRIATPRTPYVPNPLRSAAPSSQGRPATAPLAEAQQEVFAPKPFKLNPIPGLSSTQPIYPRTKTADFDYSKGKQEAVKNRDKVVAKHVVEKPQPALAESWFPKWSDCQYSPNLLKPKAELKINYPWTPGRFSVFASEDADAMANFQNCVNDARKRGKRLTNPPKLGQLVIGQYLGEYYRGVVTKIKDHVISVAFVDYGDSKDYILEELTEVDATIMKYPIYALDVDLVKVSVPSAYRLTRKDQDFIYENSFELELADKGYPRPQNPEHRHVRGTLRCCYDGTVTANEKLQQSFNASCIGVFK